MGRKKHKLVMGLGAAILNGLEPADGSFTYKESFPKILELVDNDFLFSALHCTYKSLEYLKTVLDPSDRIYIDSGGYTLFRKEEKLGKDNPEFIKCCKNARNRLLKVLNIITPKEVFELDNEYFRQDEDLLSPKNYLREEIKELTGYYPTPVFKMFQGLEYWKRLCECDLYPRLSIGGLAHVRGWHKYRDEMKVMMEYARMHNKKVHLLGCANLESFRNIMPDTIDYNISQFDINVRRTRAEHPDWPHDIKPFKIIANQIALWGFAEAMVRTHFYDAYQIDDNPDC